MVVMLVDKSRKIAVIEHSKILESWSRDAGNTEIDVHRRLQPGLSILHTTGNKLSLQRLQKNTVLVGPHC